MTPASLRTEVEGVTIFVAYARPDIDKMRRFVGTLRRFTRAEIKVDPDLTVGAEWKQQVDGWIARAEVFVLLLSPSFYESAHCLRELSLCKRQWLERDAKLVPVVLEACEQSLELMHLHTVNDAVPLAQDGDYERAGQQIGELSTQIVQFRKPRGGNLPHPPSVVFEREAEFRRIGEAFKRTQFVALTGPAGVGKSELAKAFGWWGGCAREYVFLQSEGTKQADQLHRFLKSPERPPLLVILDDVRDPVGAAESCARLPEDVQVLLTTRRLPRGWRSAPPVEEVRLCAPSLGPCTDFLLRRSGALFSDREVAERLAIELRQSPLALDVAGASIAENTNLDDYLALIGKDRLPSRTLLPRSAEIDAGFRSIRRALRHLDIDNLAAGELLRVLSFADRDRIDLNILRGAADVLPPGLHTVLNSDKQYPKVVQIIERYSLASFTPELVELHRVVRDAVRATLRPDSSRGVDGEFIETATRFWDATPSAPFAYYCAGHLWRGIDDRLAERYFERAVERAENPDDPHPNLTQFRYCWGRHIQWKDPEIVRNARHTSRKAS